MSRLSELTRAHSERISDISRLRDERLTAAKAARDRQLRALPAAARAYLAFDDQLAEISTRLSSERARAEIARLAALDAAHRSRRDADGAALEKRLGAEDAAEHKFLLSLSPAKASADAQRARGDELDRARREFDAALLASQQRF